MKKLRSACLLLLLIIFLIPLSKVSAKLFNPPTKLINQIDQFLAIAPLDTTNLPTGDLGESIKLGFKIITETKKHVPQNVGNGLSCTNCHLDAGRKPYAAPFIGIWGVFPEYRARNAEVNLLSDRINDCFQRSLNGKALPEKSKEMVGIQSYMWWLSRDIPTGKDFVGRGFKKITATSPADKNQGKKIYQARCAHCHGANGEGDIDHQTHHKHQEHQHTLIPPLWGKNSFNIGAGMARPVTAAHFIAQNMPLGEAGSLSPQEAFDVAKYITEQERPDFKDKHKDWPKGGKPKDARY